MKKIIRIIALVLICSITSCILCSPISYASDTTSTDEYEQYIEYVLPFYLRASSTYIENELSYSNPIPVYNLMTSEKEFDYVFVFDGSTIIGKIYLYFSNGYYSRFDKHIIDSIQNSFDNHIVNTYFTYDDSLYISSGDGNLVLLDGYSDISNIIEYTLPIVDSPLIFKASPLVYDNISLAAVSSNVQLDVEHVHNASTPGGKGLCWAACIAMKLNYQRNVNSYTALSVYNLTQTDPDNHAASTPHGYEVMGYNPVTISSSISASQVLGQLTRDLPVHISLEGRIVSDGKVKTVLHAVLISGITIENASSSSADITYSICDPNYRATQYMYRSMSVAGVDDNMSYCDNTYTIWYHTYY